MQRMVVARHVLILRSKGQRSRSRGNQMRCMPSWVCMSIWLHRFSRFVFNHDSAPVVVLSILLSVSVCLSVRPHAYLRNYTSDYQISVHIACGSVLLWRHLNTLCTSGFVNGIVFFDNNVTLQHQQRRNVVWILMPLLHGTGFIVIWSTSRANTGRVLRSRGAGESIWCIGGDGC